MEDYKAVNLLAYKLYLKVYYILQSLESKLSGEQSNLTEAVKKEILSLNQVIDRGFRNNEG